jgi:hypothetical protein
MEKIPTIKFLEEVYKQLDLETENLNQVENFIAFISEEDNLEKGEWLSLANYLNKSSDFTIDKIYFLENNPFIIFTTTTLPDDRLHEVYNKLWNMARPRFLFLATLSKIEVYDLSDKPAKNTSELNPLVIVQKITEIAETLKNFRREKIETGEIFGDERFHLKNFRADNSLINDLKVVRRKLFEEGLSGDKSQYAHSLIGRSIFIRYLEDRKIINKEYFEKVARKKKKWLDTLSKPLKINFYYKEMKDLLYPRVLSELDFTYALFEQLSNDFNGDIFPTDPDEINSVTKNHLKLVQKFLLNDVKDQESLFLWAYKFDIIPIELISNIYEEFYHFKNFNPKTKELKDSKGTHYTPPALVEFVLSRVLTYNELIKKPRIIDPACGSGIFLVEAFRRMVRIRLFEKNKKLLKPKEHLDWEELIQIINEQIFGIELNEEAIKIAAFSLYIAFLNYQDPPDIEKKLKMGKRLPMLICTDKKKSNKTYFDNLLRANAFEDVNNLFTDKTIIDKFSKDCFDIVIGNPPWGSPDKKDTEGNESFQIMKNWCETFQKTISDDEQSQAFLWLADYLLKPTGKACMLVSSGVLLKFSNLANKFKNIWLSNITLKEVVNFIHVRDVFFKKGISPFLVLKFNKQKPSNQDFIQYLTVRKTKIIDELECVILDNNDFKFIRYSEITNDIWKVFWFGSRFDLNLINLIRVSSKFEKYVNKKNVGRGFQEGNKKNDALWLSEYKEYPTKRLFHSKYGSLDFDSNVFIKTPLKVEHRGRKELYMGNRILIKRGITEKESIKPKGQIMVRFENAKFAFRNSVHSVKLKEPIIDNYLFCLGILWSSISRYYFFMTASSWHWHNEVHINEILNLPIIFDCDPEIKQRIILIVKLLRNKNFNIEKITNISNLKDIRKIITQSKQQELNFNLKSSVINNIGFNIYHEIESKLDEAIFDLYMLTEPQRDLIRDRCFYDIDHFYYGSNSIAVEPVRCPIVRYGNFSSISHLQNKNEFEVYLEDYIELFLNEWSKYLEVDEEFNWQYFYSRNKEMLAIIFTLQERGKIIKPNISENNDQEWKEVLTKLQKATQIKYSERIYIEGLVIAVTPEQIFIIKRNEKRLWTRSAARMDAESTVVKAVNLREA